MGAAASTRGDIDKHVKVAISGAVTRVVTSQQSEGGSGSYAATTKSFKDHLRPVLLSQKTIKSFAVKNHAKENMSYIPQDPVMGSFAIKAATTANASMRKVNVNSNFSNNSLVKSTDVDTPPKRPGQGLKLNLGLKLMLTEDESDWIQVSDDEEDAPLSPRRKKLELPSVCGEAGLTTKQSLMFTNSGTIFVDGFSEGIGKDGIHNNDGSSHFLITERIVLVCNLGQGASGTVYKALDLAEMRIVALKCISVFERGKRRQMVRELGALFDMLHSTEFQDDISPQGDVPKTARSTPKAVEFNDIVRRASTASATSDEGKQKDQTKNPKEHIVDFYDAFSNLEDGGVALMMEYMDGGSLQDIADAGGVDDEGTLASIAYQVLSGLNFLHQCNQIHRDIKPANILINHDGTVKVSDLGILKKIDPITAAGAQDKKHLPTIPSMDDPGTPLQRSENGESKVGGEDPQTSTETKEDQSLPLMTTDTAESSGKHLNIDDGEMYRANTFVGTVTYMAPERIDSRPYTFNSDVWSFGLSLLTVALGKLPIDSANGFWSVLNAIRDKPPPVLPDDGNWSDDIRDFIKQCLTPSPVNRPSCEELLKHPFIRKAAPDNFEEDSVHVEDRGKKELRAIVKALHTHLENLKAGYDKAGAKDDSTSSIQNHVLAQAVEAQGVNEVLRLLLFGREPTMRAGELLKEGGQSTHRLAALARQLHLPLRATLMEAKRVCREILMMTRDNSHASTSVDNMEGVRTPNKENFGSLENDDITAPLYQQTPKARHDNAKTMAPTPKARHDLK